MQTTTKLGAILAAGVMALSVGLATPAYAAPKEKEDKVARALALNDQYLGDSNAATKLSPQDLALMQEMGVEATVTTKSKVQREDPLTGELEAVDAGEDGITTFAAYTCYRGSYEYIGWSAAGIKLYRSWHVGRWCTNATTVSSAAIAESGYNIYFLGWNSAGRINGGAGVVSAIGRSWTQYKFTYQLGTPWPTQTTTPCNRVGGLFYGTYYVGHTCSIY